MNTLGKSFLISLLAVLPALASDTPTDTLPVSLEGTLVPVREVHMASRAKGVIRYIREEGERVHLGEPILILEDSLEKLEVSRQKKILELRSVEDSAEEQLRKKDVVSNLELAEKKLNLDLAQMNVQQAQELLDRRAVTAPFDGVVTQRGKSAGEAVDELAQVLTLVDINNLYLECHLPAEMRNRIREGESVAIHVDSPLPADATGTVQICSPVINPASGDFKVRVLVSNPTGQLTAGVRAKGTITSVQTSTPAPTTSTNSASVTPVSP